VSNILENRIMTVIDPPIQRSESTLSYLLGLEQEHVMETQRTQNQSHHMKIGKFPHIVTDVT
jgi:hypothetical protein